MSQFKSGVSRTGGESGYAAGAQHSSFPNGPCGLRGDRSKLPMPAWVAKIHFHVVYSLRKNNRALRTVVCSALCCGMRVIRQTSPGHEASPLYIQGIQRKTGNPPLRALRKCSRIPVTGPSDTDALRKDNAASNTASRPRGGLREGAVQPPIPIVIDLR